MKRKLKKLTNKKPSLRLKKRDVNERFDDAVKSLPKITNDTLAEHREEVIASARKYIYPLQYSKHKIVAITSILVGLGIVGLFVYCVLSLYKFQNTSTFIYDVSKVVPFPVAKAGSRYVSYENYLFELRHSMHYYESQQNVNFSDPTNKDQLLNLKKQALQQVIDYAYIDQLADENHVTVSTSQLNNEVTTIENEDNLGNNVKEFDTVLSEFWGWSMNDFKRELKQQLLAENLVSKLDTGTWARANAATAELQKGVSFAKVAAQYSDDSSTKSHGGQFGFTITPSSRNVPPQTLKTLLALKPGQTSVIINLGNALEIDKVLSVKKGNITAAHILFNFKNINTYLQPYEKQNKTHRYISIS